MTSTRDTTQREAVGMAEPMFDLIRFGPVDPDLPAHTPVRAHPDDAGFDLVVTQTAVIRPGEFADLKTNVWVAVPVGWWGLITGRSSALRKLGLLVHSGVIDGGYRGELFAGAFNLSGKVVKVEAGQRVAQFIPMPQPMLVPHWVDGPAPSGTRGTDGFGSTGA